MCLQDKQVEFDLLQSEIVEMKTKLNSIIDDHNREKQGLIEECRSKDMIIGLAKEDREKVRGRDTCPVSEWR